MAGICSYGAYVPPSRLALATIAGRTAPEDGPERSVAWNDEDSVTMGVAAGISCLAGFDRDSVDALLFASTSYPFREKQGASLIARALDLRRDIRTQDHGGSLRAGTAALRTAADAVSAGSARAVLVIISDCRSAAPGSGLESAFGDGAAAFLVGDRDPIAEFEDWSAISDEIGDVWRSETDRFVHSWEDRFVVQEGYTPRLLEAVQALLQKTKREISDFDRVALYAPDRRSHATVARKLGARADTRAPPSRRYCSSRRWSRRGRPSGFWFRTMEMARMRPHCGSASTSRNCPRAAAWPGTWRGVDASRATTAT